MLLQRLAQALLIASIAVQVPADASTFDAVTDFSNTTNTASSTWQYLFATDQVRDGSYTLFSTNSDPVSQWSPSNPFWHSASGGATFETPGIGVNRSGGPLMWLGNGFDFNWPDQTIWVHPSGDPGIAILRWLSPLTGLINIDFSIADMDPNTSASTPDGIDWFIDRNDQSDNLAFGSLPGNGDMTGPQSLTNVAVSAGDTIDIVIDSRSNFFFDSTAVTATISTVVPEPGTSALVGLGALVLLLWRRRSGLPA